MKKNPIKVLVFGGVGTGKTSACNILAEQEHPVSNAAVGVTFQFEDYEPFFDDEIDIHLTDTVGLNEGSKGTVSPTDAIKSLIKLLKKSVEGYSLLIQVMRCGRITKDLEDNYKFFFEALCQEKIPILLIVTHCEEEEPMSVWIEQNKHSFEHYNFNYHEMIATCFAKGKREKLEEIYAPLRVESKKNVIEAIKEHSLEKPKKFIVGSKGIRKVFIRAWGAFCDWANVNWHIRPNKNIEKILKDMGLSEKEARDESYEL